ncbi:hypothetical protein NKW44_14755 [Acetobacter lovaniensis]|jgi:hypothetical protein|uniref:hypothetical protein n=1 Tax=Acetobacter lovaniensis TaxID=104100 RepID=UPI00209F7F1A|nr:hypothetical protein [Acetobacter lovaniensis]MCI1796574.1 hypothetical protein [Acetobacter lovaniensis]MCP1240920.1 hypothetical protein [Acetobacter lovaniensis]
MSRKELALAELETMYAKVRSHIQNAAENADFSFIGSLVVIQENEDSFKNQMAVFGNEEFLIPCAAVAFGAAMKHHQAGRDPQQIAGMVNTCLNLGENAEQKPWEQTPCSTMKH